MATQRRSQDEFLAAKKMKTLSFDFRWPFAVVDEKLNQVRSFSLLQRRSRKNEMDTSITLFEK